MLLAILPTVLLKIYKALTGKKDRWKLNMRKFYVSRILNILRDNPICAAYTCTSDMYWAGRRLGKDRVKNAYAYKNYLKIGNHCFRN
jgi:hypothetical protein